MITLIEKKDKDKILLKNWRPISMINMDVKIASIRLESILPFITAKMRLLTFLLQIG